MHKRFVAAAVAVFALASVASSPLTASGNGPEQRSVELRDSCDVATFNAAIPAPPGQPPTCVPHERGSVLFDDFGAALNPVTHAGHDAWRINPDHTTIRVGDQLSVAVRGGEFHTFTEVNNPNPRPGCIDALNVPLGLGKVATTLDCTGLNGIFATTGVAPGGPSRLVTLPVGTHYFMCFIHPWMRSTIVVAPR